MRAVTTLVLLLLVACAGGADTPEDDAAAAEVAAVEAAARTEPRRILTSDRIYYDLTRFPWYARGEPLQHEGLAYQPAGNPLGASLEEMDRAGEYEGVEYYRRQGDDQTLYVPVFDGYWLAFRPVATGARAD